MSRLSSDRGSISSMSVDAHTAARSSFSQASRDADPDAEEMETIDDDDEQHGAGQEEEEEEILEELADVAEPSSSEDNGAIVMSRNDFAGLILATQAAALLALQTLLQEMQSTIREGSEAYAHLIDVLVSAVTELSSQETAASQREEGFKRLNSLLDSLSSEALVVGSQGSGGDGVNLATALGDLLLSLDRVRPASDPAAVEAARLQALPPVRQRSSSTVSSSPSHELRDPFAETSSEPNVFATLHRLIASLAARCPLPQRRLGSSPLISSHDGGVASFPRRFGDGYGSMQGARSSTSSLATASSYTSSIVVDSRHLAATADPEAWSHVGHILGLTRDLVASRRASQSMRDAGGAMSPHRTRSRKDSTSSSSNADPSDMLAADATRVRRSLQQSRRGGATAGSLQRKPSTGSLRTSVSSNGTGTQSMPPSYSEHDRRREVGATDAQIRDYQSRGILPSYGYDEKNGREGQGSSGGKDRLGSSSPPRSILKKTGLIGRPDSQLSTSEDAAATSSLSHSSCEGLRLQKSLERAYANAPQLNDQRANATPSLHQSRSRDVTLQELIDRLAASGKRLDDQRCAPPLPPGQGAKSKENIGAMPSPSSRDSRHEKGANSGMRSSVLRKLSSGVHLGSIRRSSKSKAKEKEKEKASVSAAASPALGTLPMAMEAAAHSSGWLDTRSGSSSSGSGGLRSHDASGVSMRSLNPREEEAEGAALFELLAASSSKSRFADQEAVMRSSRDRRLGGGLAVAVASPASFKTAPATLSSPADWAGPAVPAKSPPMSASSQVSSGGAQKSDDMKTIRAPPSSASSERSVREGVFARQQKEAMAATMAAKRGEGEERDFQQGADKVEVGSMAPSPNQNDTAATTPRQERGQDQTQVQSHQYQQHRKAVPVL